MDAWRHLDNQKKKLQAKQRSPEPAWGSLTLGPFWKTAQKPRDPAFAKRSRGCSLLFAIDELGAILRDLFYWYLVNSVLTTTHHPADTDTGIKISDVAIALFWFFVGVALFWLAAKFVVGRIVLGIFLALLVIGSFLLDLMRS